MSETEENDQDEQEEPSGVVKDCNKCHNGDGDDKDTTAPLSEKGIGDVASI